MKKIILIIISILIICLGIFAFIPKNNFVMPEIPETTDNLLNIMDMDKYIQEINKQEILYSRNWQVNGDLLGKQVSKYIQNNNMTEIGIRTNMTKNSVEFISFDKKINNQKFYYTDEGKLVMYITSSNNNLDQIKYYFKDNKQISINKECEDESTYIIEDESELLKRANNIYNEYIIEKECKITSQQLTETIVNNDGIVIGNVTCNYPILSRNEQSKVIDKINKKIKQEAESRYNENIRILQNIGMSIASQNLVTDNMQEQIKPIEQYNYYIIENYEQKYLDYKTISYVINIKKYIGEQIEIERISKNYDLLTGKELELSDIHNLSQNELNEKLINKFQIKYDRQLYNDSVLSRNISKVKFYLTDDYVAFYFEKEVISNNMLEIQIKNNELK
ncbi:MAG: DUF4163 domain-containing protein [Clostridiales bacterium]|nr:DUF4163 domain-containing protein [Clostridiales bacterium]